MITTRTGFVELVYAGDVEVVKEAIKRKCDINELDAAGDTGIIAAIKKNDYRMLKVLINAGADVDIKSGSGEHPLNLAKAMAKDDDKYLDKEIIKLIENSTKEKPVIDNKTKKSSIFTIHRSPLKLTNKTPLTVASTSQDTPIVPSLLSQYMQEKSQTSAPPTISSIPSLKETPLAPTFLGTSQGRRSKKSELVRRNSNDERITFKRKK